MSLSTVKAMRRMRAGLPSGSQFNGRSGLGFALTATRQGTVVRFEVRFQTHGAPMRRRLAGVGIMTPPPAFLTEGCPNVGIRTLDETGSAGDNDRLTDKTLSVKSRSGIPDVKKGICCVTFRGGTDNTRGGDEVDSSMEGRRH